MLSTPYTEDQRYRERTDTPYLKVQLTSQLPALVLMQDAQEALIVPAEQLTLIPNMAHYMLGLLNRRGRIYWVIDLPMLLGMPSSVAAMGHYHIVLVNVNGLQLGWAVAQVQEVIRLATAVSPLSNTHCPEALKPFVRGEMSVESQSLFVLEPTTIFDAAASPTIFSSSADFSIHS